jgi:uroporphyrinogen-III synthase
VKLSNTANLKNKILAITRKETDAQEFSQLVRAEGGNTISLPAIKVVPKDPKVIKEFISRIKENKYDYCTFMSSQAVEVLFKLSRRVNKSEEIRSVLNSTTIVAVGPKTSSSLKRKGVNVAMMPETYSSQGIIKLFLKKDMVRGKKVIIPRSAASNEFVRNGLIALGMVVDELFIYDVLTANIDNIWYEFVILLKEKKIDVIVFTSSSAVQSFFVIMSRLSCDVASLLDGVKAIISIGPLTSAELTKRNVCSFEAREHTIKGTFYLAKDALSQLY